MNKSIFARLHSRSLCRSISTGAALSVALLAGGLFGGASPAFAQNAAAQADIVTVGQPAVLPGEFNGDLSKLPISGMSVAPPIYRQRLPGPPNAKNALPGADVAPAAVPAGPLAPMPPTIQNFAGLNFGDACTGGQCGAGWPPDTNGDVGPNHYILTVNDAVGIYSKTGTLLASFTENNLWSGVGSTPCNGNAFGDPVTIYDKLADRFVITWFAFALSGGNPVSPFYECIAASKTADPVAGGWWLYEIRMDPGTVGTPPVGNLNDYPKFGLWHDCLYMASNEFLFPAGTYQGVAVASFSRADLYSGAPLTFSLAFLPYPANDVFTLIPSNNNGKGVNAAQPGTPNYLTSESASVFAYLVRKFTPGANCGGGGTIGAPTTISQTAYTFVQGAIVPQPNTANTLDMIDDRLMQKVQYRKIGATESLWITHPVRVPTTTNVTMQWAQLDVTGGVVAAAPVQQGFQQPDATLFRFMGSIAADKYGNAALGYTTSNGTAPNFPSVVYAGRLASDPLNTLPQTEVAMILGGGSQANSCGGPCDRWGDYSAMSVDPVDDCTFWYTNEYYDNQTSGNAGNWHVRIGSFKFPSCIASGTTLLSSLNPSVFGNNVTFTATVNGVLPTGTVTIKDGGSTLCSGPLGGGGDAPTFQCITNTLAVGTHSMTADYAGDAGNNPSSSVAFNQVVNSAGGSGLVCSPNPQQELQPVTCVMTITGNNPTGFVTFKDGGVNIAGCVGKPLTGVGNTKTAQCMTSMLSVGTHPIVAEYTGDRLNPAAVSNIDNEVINPRPATTTTLTTSMTPQVYGQPVIFTATVAGASPTGTVNFKDGASSIPGCGARVLVAAVATCSINSLSIGTHSNITGNYGGDIANAPSSSAALTQDITCIPGRGCIMTDTGKF